MKLKRTIQIVVILALVVGYTGGSWQPGRAAGDYTYNIEVTIDADQVDATLTDFPVYLTDTIADLATTGNGGYIENTDATGGASGSVTVPADFDIGNTDTCGDVTYSFEFETYDDSTGEFDLWVKIPSLDDTTDTVIYFCFGDSGTSSSQENVTDVWSNDFVSVWHLAESSGTFYDSVGNHNATDYVSATGKDGKVGPGQEFDGTDRAEPGAHADFRDTTVTVSLWEWADSTGDSNDVLFDNSTSSPGGGEGGYMHKKGGRLTTREIGQSGVTSRVSSITAETWEYVSMVIDLSTGTQTIYLDGGAETDTDTIDTFTPSSNTVRIGARNDATWFDPFTGYIDEVRFSSVLRSGDWISTTYNNQSAPGTFASFAAAVETSGAPDVVMGDSSVSGVPAGLKTAVETALGTYRPEEDIEGLEPPEYSNMYAITSYTETDEEDYYWVSLVGMVVPDPEDLDGWDLSWSVWSGLVIAEDNGDTTYTAHVEGSTGYDLMVDAAGIADIAAPNEGGTGASTIYFPWAAGYSAWYGPKGVHGAGPADPTWGGVGYRAVDWVGGATGFTQNIFPNGAFVSQSGTVDYVCRDDIQTWVQIGDFLYGHLVDNATLREGVYHSQGTYLAAIVTGTHLTPATASRCDGPIDAKCGYMCQQPTNYHIHWGFKPTGSYFNVEGWVLNTNTEVWTKGADTVGPTDYMLAEWSERPEVPTPGPTITPGGPTPTPGVPYVIVEGGGGGQIWDGFIAGAKNVVKNRIADINELGEYQDNMYENRNIITTVTSGARIVIRTLYVLLRSNLNLTITLLVFSMIIIIEPIRILRSLWIMIKEMIPFL